MEENVAERSVVVSLMAENVAERSVVISTTAEGFYNLCLYNLASTFWYSFSMSMKFCML